MEEDGNQDIIDYIPLFEIEKIYLDCVRADKDERFKHSKAGDFVERKEHTKTFKGLAVVVPSQRLKSRYRFWLGLQLGHDVAFNIAE